MLDGKRRFVKAHKAATVLYDRERAKSEGGLSVRNVEKIIKKKHNEIGPSSTTIHHYVVNLGLVGISPIKPGPVGNIPPLIYKALCAAFGSLMRINQINALAGDNSRSKMVPIIAKAMNLTSSAAYNLIRRLCRDTAIDMKANKLYFAEERRVRWTTYSNLETAGKRFSLTSDFWKSATLVSISFVTSC